MASSSAVDRSGCVDDLIHEVGFGYHDQVGDIGIGQFVFVYHTNQRFHEIHTGIGVAVRYLNQFSYKRTLTTHHFPLIIYRVLQLLSRVGALDGMRVPGPAGWIFRQTVSFDGWTDVVQECRIVHSLPLILLPGVKPRIPIV